MVNLIMVEKRAADVINGFASVRSINATDTDTDTDTLRVVAELKRVVEANRRLEIAFS